VVNVRADGIAVVLGPLLRDSRIVAATLVDVDSGMVLDAWSAEGPDGTAAVAPDLELIGAQHAEVVRCALALLRTRLGPRKSLAAGSEGDTCEVVLGADGGCQHLLRTLPDPHGDRLALAVVVDGAHRVLDRVRKRLRAVSVDALTAGPSMTRRPVRGGWSFAMPAPDVPAWSPGPSPPQGPPGPPPAFPPTESVPTAPPLSRPPVASPPPRPIPSQPVPSQPVPSPPVPSPPVPSQPALVRLAARRATPSGPGSERRPAPVVAVPSRPAAVPDPLDAPAVPHLWSARPEPPPEAAGTGTSQRASAGEERTRPGSPPSRTEAADAGAAPRPPSPPAALPAPAPPRPSPS
jgi:hypothetical protein